MPRPRVSVPPEAIRIEDEVWQDAFARIEQPSRRRLHAIDGGRAGPAPAPPAATATLTPPAPPRRSLSAPRTPVARSAGDYPRVRQPPASDHSGIATTLTADTTVAPSVSANGIVQPEPASMLPRASAASTVAGRRTVTIRGYGAERNLPWPDGSRRRSQRPVYERAGFRPDRLAMWAVLLGVLLLIVAVASAHS